MSLNLDFLKLTLFIVIFSSLTACGGGSSTVTQNAASNATNNASNLGATTNQTPTPAEVVTEPTIQKELHSGVVQKGPFAVDSKVTIERLDSAAVITGELIETKVTHDKGQFLYEIPDDWNLEGNNSFLQIRAKGSIFDESTGLVSSQKVNLVSITHTPDSSSVNVLTHWKVQRARVLVSKGASLTNALKQAEEELYDLFGANNLNQLDFTHISDSNQNNALLILLSGALMEVANKQNVNVQLIIDQIGEDFSAEGAIDLSGNDWLKKIQASIRDNPALHVSTYARNLRRSLGLTVVTGADLPDLITFASRPSAILPSEVFAEPGETIVLDGSASHDNEEGALVNYTWFRVDQQTQYVVPLSDRFDVAPSITVPDEESTLLFALVVTDVNDLTDTNVIKVIVKIPPPTNNPPTAEDQPVFTEEDTPVAIDLIANDQDGDTLSYNLTTPLLLLNGLLEGTPPNLIYTPDQNFHGSDSFTFTVSDDAETSPPASVDIIVSPVNDRPLAFDQPLTTNENQPITNLVLSGFDVDGDPLSFSILSSPSHGTLVGASPNHSYTPDAGYNGSDSFIFVSNDGLLDSIPAIVSINILSVNDAPIAVSDNYTTDEDTSVTITPLANDTDIDSDVLQVSSINGSALSGGVQSIPVNNGSVEISPSGAITFVPNNNAFGDFAFSYQISDGNGGSAGATITITVTPINDDPIAVNDSYNTDEDETIILNPLNGDSDPENDSLSITSINGFVISGGIQTIIVTDGTVDISATGSISFTPDTAFSGQVTIPYVISDGNGGTATANQIITVNLVNDAPTAVNDSYAVDEDNTQVLTPLVNDTDPDADTLAVSAINGVPLTGSTQTIPVSNGDVAISASGVIEFIPDDNFSGSVNFPYEISDGNGAFDSATISIKVSPINDDPIAVDDNYNMLEDGTIILTPLTADTDIDGGTLVISSINGTTFTGNPQIIPVTNGVINIDMGGGIDFSPSSNFFGTVTIPYSISDGNGGTATANEIIGVVSVNDAPEATSDTYAVNEDTTATGNVVTGDNGVGVDTDIDGDTLTVTAAMIDIDADGNVDNLPLATPTDLLDGSSVPYGSIEINADGSFTFIPVLDFNGAIPTLTYTISDGNGGSSSAKLNITILAVNDAPTARSFTLEVNQGENVSFVKGPGPQQLGGTDPENDPLTVTDRSDPLNSPSTGTIFVTNLSTSTIYTYVPNASFCGTDSIQYKVKEIGGDQLKSAFATVTFNVNCKPTAGPISDITLTGSPQAITLTGTDSDGSIASYTITAPPAKGSLKDSSGTVLSAGSVLTSSSVTYTPNSLSSPETDDFSYIVTDDLGLDSNDTNVNLIGLTVVPRSTYIKAENPDPSPGAVPDNIVGDFFGGSVSLSADGTTLAVGALGKARVYMYVLTGSGWVQQAALTKATAGGDSFGSVVSLSNDGNTLVVGASSEDSNATGVNGDQTDNSLSSSGAAYIFKRTGTSWSQQAYLKASNTDSFDRFGTTVNVSGDGNTVVVGTPSEDSNATGINASVAAQLNDSFNSAGAVYVFRFDGTNWAQEAYIKASNTGSGDSFGRSVALNGLGDSLIVAATGEDTTASSSGAMYHFVRTGSGWSQQGGVIKATDAGTSDFLGNQIAMSDDGNTFVVSAPDNNSFSGTGIAYVFAKVSGSWVQQTKLLASNAEQNDSFGDSVSISADGNKILVGATGENSSSVGILGADPSLNDAIGAGASYLFERSGVSWSQTTYIKSSNTNGSVPNSSGSGDNFGTSVALSDDGNTTAVGAELEESSSPGINGDQTINGFIGAGAVYVNPHLQ